MHRFARQFAVATAGALVLLAAAAGISIAADKWVTMYDSKYLPGPVTIRPGDTVTWVNDDDLPHDAVGNGWATPLLNKGDSHAVTFTKAGTYRYTCTIHPQMSSRVIVRAAGGGLTPPPTDLGPATVTPVTAPLLLLAAAGILGFGLAVRRAARR